MPHFVLNRAYTMRSVYGHVVNFKKGEPTYVPPICAREAISIGADPVDEKVDVLGPEAAPEMPMSPDERQENILAAFRLLVERNGDDFDASGLPTVKAMTAVLGFDVDKKEYKALWTAYKAENGL